MLVDLKFQRALIATEYLILTSRLTMMKLCILRERKRSCKQGLAFRKIVLNTRLLMLSGRLRDCWDINENCPILFSKKEKQHSCGQWDGSVSQRIYWDWWDCWDLAPQSLSSGIGDRYLQCKACVVSFCIEHGCYTNCNGLVGGRSTWRSWDQADDLRKFLRLADDHPP